MLTGICQEVESDKNIYLGFGCFQVSEEVLEDIVDNRHITDLLMGRGATISNTELGVDSKKSPCGCWFTPREVS